MNIFYLDKNITKCAQYHCDKHIVKMILEYAQLLSTTKRLNGDDNSILYKSAFVNHPANIWVRSNIKHYKYLYLLLKAVLKEYTFRYNKIHKVEREGLFSYLKNFPNLPNIKFQEPPKLMPDEYKVTDVVTSYRNYYIKDKLRFAKWKKRNIPDWVVIC